MQSADVNPAPPSKPSSTDLQRSFLRHLQYTLVRDKYSAAIDALREVDSYLLLADYAREIRGISPEQVSRHSRRDLQ